jgi:hypothetical protein
MGMLFAMMLVLTFASVVLEMFLVKKIRPLKWLNRKSAIVGIVMSMALSWALGLIFGIAGLTAGIAGVLSTVISEPIHAVGRARERGKTKLDLWVNEFMATYRPVFRIIKICFVLMFLPIWAPVLIRRYFLAYKALQLQSGHGKALLALTGPDFWTENFVR